MLNSSSRTGSRLSQREEPGRRRKIREMKVVNGTFRSRDEPPMSYCYRYDRLFGHDEFATQRNIDT